MGSGRFAPATATVALTALGLLGGAAAARAAASPPASPPAPSSTLQGSPISTQGVVTLLARRYPWIREVLADQLQVQEVQTGGGVARLVWVSARVPGQGVRHVFAVLARSEDGRRDVFTDLTPLVDAGRSTFVPLGIEFESGVPGFVLGSPAVPPEAAARLYAILPPRVAPPPDAVVVLGVEGDLIGLDRDEAGRLRVRAGRYERARASEGVLAVPQAEPGSGAGPVRSVAVTTFTWSGQRRAFEATSTAPVLTAFGVAEAFLQALNQGDMDRALKLTSAEWRQVLGVSSPEGLERYLKASRAGLLGRPGARYRLMSARLGEESASLLFADAEGRIYRIRLRLGAANPREMLVLPGQRPAPRPGPWEVDGLDGGG